MSDLVEAVARAICCSSGVCANQDVEYAVCQAHTFKVEARAALQAIEEQGYVVVPREASEAMLRAGFIDTRYDAGHGERTDVYRAMIAAAPKGTATN